MRISDWSSDVCSSDLVETALASQNVEIPAGRIESRDREFSVVSSTDLQTPAQFAAIVVANVKGYPVRLGDVAKVEIGAADDRILSRFNGRPAINIGLTRQTTANPLDLSRAVRSEIAQIHETLPTRRAEEHTSGLQTLQRKS